MGNHYFLSSFNIIFEPSFKKFNGDGTKHRDLKFNHNKQKDKILNSDVAIQVGYSFTFFLLLEIGTSQKILTKQGVFHPIALHFIIYLLILSTSDTP